MKTQILNPSQINKVAKLLNDGKIVAIPTDTVLGLGVISNNATSIANLRMVKQRPDDKALAYMVDNLAKIEAVCDLVPRDYKLIELFLPGPVTFIFNKKKQLPIVDESGLNTLAIRIPDHPFIIELISKLPVGLYVPSANISSQPPATKYQEVIEIFNGKIDGIVMLDSLNLASSTIIDASQEQLKCLRVGPISLSEIEKRLKEHE